jgi:chromosome segregation ATPase
VRRVLSGADPEARLEELLANRRRELDEHAARLRESIAELERREELLRDSRASVERMLRLGTNELEARESELSSFLHEITERETSLTAAEHDLERRRQELGAVELKRAAVERRERALADREAEVEEREARAAALLQQARPRAETVGLAFVPGAEYRLVELEAKEVAAGVELDVGDTTYTVARIGRSPLPGDERRCAYLVRGIRGRDSSGSS